MVCGSPRAPGERLPCSESDTRGQAERRVVDGALSAAARGASRVTRAASHEAAPAYA